MFYPTDAEHTLQFEPDAGNLKAASIFIWTKVQPVDLHFAIQAGQLLSKVVSRAFLCKNLLKNPFWTLAICWISFKDKYKMSSRLNENVQV